MDGTSVEHMKPVGVLVPHRRALSLERMRMNDRQMLDEMGIIYDVIEADLSRLAQRDISTAQSRLDGLDDEQVKVYAECMKNGDVFPEIVVSVSSNDRVYVLSGNHRVAAARSIGRATLPALRVTNLTDAQKQLIVAGANNKHGKNITIDDRRAQACAMVEVFGWTLVDSARQFSLTVGQIETALQARRSHVRWDQLAQNNKMPAKKHGNDRMRNLMRLRSDKAYVAAAEASPLLQTNEFDALVAEANRKLNEDEAVELFASVIRRADDRARSTGTKKASGATPLAAVSRMDNSLHKLTIEMARSQTDEDKTETIIHLHRMSTRIRELLDGIA